MIFNVMTDISYIAHFEIDEKIVNIILIINNL